VTGGLLAAVPEPSIDYTWRMDKCDRRQVAVCGPSVCTPEQARHAYRIGQMLAAAGATVICGGGPGVMDAVARGATEHGGLAVGVLSSPKAEDASPTLSVTVATGLGQARNAFIINSADAVIVVGGSWGTLSELAIAMRVGTAPIVLDGWRVVDQAGQPVPGPVAAGTPEEAVRLALSG
jgi:uncharacterized protein (TIGR00725 family)